MTDILNEIKAIREILEKKLSETPKRQFMRVPEAARQLGIGTVKLRRLIEDGTIPARCINPEGKHKHYIIDIAEAVKALKV